MIIRCLIFCLTAVVLILGQSNDVKDLLEATIKLLESQKNYKVRFTGKISATGSDDINIEGVALQVNPDLLYVDYRASGGQVQFIIKKGIDAKIWHQLAEQWVDSHQLGNPSAARGIQNPQELLSILRSNIDKIAQGSRVSKDSKGTFIELSITGTTTRDILSENLSQTSIKWDKSSASCKIHLRSDDQLVESVEVSANIPADRVTVSYEGRIYIESYNKDTELIFYELDDRGKPARKIVIPDSLKKAMGIK